MTRFRIREQQASVTVELTEVGDKQAALLDTFQECQEGRCDCPTDQYQKVSAMAVEPGENQIQITLKAKPGEHFDTAEIANCLDHTISKVAEEA